MKKIVMMLTCVFSVIAHGAENNKDLMLSVGGTLFHIVKDDMYKYHASVDLMVVGRNQQRALKKPNFGDSREVGRIYPTEEKTVRVLAPQADSASDDDTYKPYVIKDTKLWEKAEDKALECNVFAIIEPRIEFDLFMYDQKDFSYGYFPTRPHPEKKNYFVDKEFYGDEAILEARRDLIMCYLTALQYGLEELGDKDDKKIALASLGGDVGVPREKAAPVAFAAIIDFLTNNPGKYSLVELFIKKRSELVLYRELVTQYLAAQL